MFAKSIMILGTAGVLAAITSLSCQRPDVTGSMSMPETDQWDVHDRERPNPPTVNPGVPGNQTGSGHAPSDAVVLFDGTNLSQWESQKDGEAKWKVGKGYFEVAPKTGGIRTKQGFGDCQLHIEWSSPDPAKGKDQDRGNSGIFLMGIYEVQVLDSYQSTTYADGQAAALYGQHPPLVNASRPPGQWQSYDIIFRGPRFDTNGNVLHKAKATVFHNGVLVQENAEFTGPTTHKRRPPYEAHAPKLPISLQDHSHPVRFRNIWIRELGSE